MSKADEAADVFMGFLILVAIGFAIWLVPKVWGWQVRNWQSWNQPYHYYCQSLKKIVKADPIFEDNGKYEDESYRVTYEDGATGLVDQARLSSGYYCVSESWMSEKEADAKGLVQKP